MKILSTPPLTGLNGNNEKTGMKFHIRAAIAVSALQSGSATKYRGHYYPIQEQMTVRPVTMPYPAYFRRIYKKGASESLSGVFWADARQVSRLKVPALEPVPAERDSRIGALHEEGKTQREIAAEVGCGFSAISSVIAPKRNSFEMEQPAPTPNLTSDFVITASEAYALVECHPCKCASPISLPQPSL